MKRIPVYILTGFLGSGKTTVLKRMLEDLKRRKKQPALIMNELGSENVERERFGDEPMIELLNGCICCTIQDDLRAGLEQFLHSNKDIDALLIEGTGIANPAEIIEVLTHPDLIDLVELQTVVGVVDGSRYLDYQSLFQSSKEVRTVLRQQITTSTLLIVNKTDLMTEKTLKKVEAKIKELKKSGVPMVFSSYGEVENGILFDKRIMTEPLKIADTSVCSEHDHTHGHTHNHTFQAIKIDGINQVNRISFESWLKTQPETLLRAKGYIRFDDAPAVYSFQYASKLLELSPLQDQKEPCMILIGTDLKREIVRDSFKRKVLV